MTCKSFTYNWSTPDATIGKINELEKDVERLEDEIPDVTTSINTIFKLTSTGDELADVDFYGTSTDELVIISKINKPSSFYVIEYGSSRIQFITHPITGNIDVHQNDANFIVRSTTPLIRIILDNFNMNTQNLLTITYNGQTQSVSASCTVDSYKNNVLTLGALLDVLYPVGSIYISMNHISPSLIFGGSWKQITDCFMYCSNESKQTGGSKKITVDQLPAHNHSFTGTYANGQVGYESGLTGLLSNNYQVWGEGFAVGDGRTQRFKTEPGISQNLVFSYTPKGTIGDTGSGADYLPPYITIYAWYRIT